jgi:hypothetical protein
VRRAEAAIETWVGQKLHKWLKEIGIDGHYLKLTVPGFRGWPDRMILWQGGHVMFVEFKQPGAEYQPLQKYVHGLLAKMGFIVEVHDDRNVALESIKEKIRATI